jgi:hypothetical protein
MVFHEQVTPVPVDDRFHPVAFDQPWHSYFMTDHTAECACINHREFLVILYQQACVMGLAARVRVEYGFIQYYKFIVLHTFNSGLGFLEITILLV